MQPRISIIAPLILAAAAGSTSYHIASAGSDARTVSEATSEATPWASFSNLARLALQPGDSILVHRGDTLRGTLRISRSGSQASPIVVSSYGTVAQTPTILGTIPVTGWIQASPGKWKAKVPSGHAVTRLYADGLPLRNARFPDTGWFRTLGHLGDTAVFASEASTGDWTGASLYLWNLNWDMEGHRVKSQLGNRLVLQRKNGIAIADTALYALTNHPLALRIPGTWIYQASDSTLLYLGDKPADSALEASVHSAGIDLRGASWVTVHGLDVVASADTGILSDGQGIVVENCQVRFSDHVGIHLQGSDGVVRDCRVSGSSSAGITVRGKRGRAERNTVSRVMVADWLGPNGMGASCCTGNGLNAWGDSSLARQNRVDSIGFNGIGFGGFGTKVTENHVSHFCMLANDCAGIYGGPQFIAPPGTDLSRVSRNLVHDSHRSAWPWPWPAANGIYLDAHSHCALVDSNTIWNVDKGFHGNNGSELVYRDNLIYSYRYAPGDFANNDSLRFSTPVGAVLTNNLVVAGSSQRTDFSLYVPQSWQSTAKLAAEANTYCEDQMSRILCRKDSVKLWSAPTVDPQSGLFGEQSIPNGSFDSATLGWRRWPSQVVLSPDSGSRCPTAHCLRVDYAGDTVAGSPYLGTAPVIKTDSAQGWWLQFQARSRRPGMKITAVLRRPTDYVSVGPSISALLDTSWQEVSFHFKANQRFDSARLDIHFPKKDSTFWLDGIRLRKDADSTAYATLGPRTILLWNALSTADRQSLPSGHWVDESGRDASSPVQIPSYSGRVFFRVASDPVALRVHSFRSAGWSVRQRNGTLLLSDLVAPADLFDARGRWIARITPDASGKALWQTPTRMGLVWIRSGGLSQTAILAR